MREYVHKLCIEGSKSLFVYFKLRLYFTNCQFEYWNLESGKWRHIQSVIKRNICLDLHLTCLWMLIKTDEIRIVGIPRTLDMPNVSSIVMPSDQTPLSSIQRCITRGSFQYKADCKLQPRSKHQRTYIIKLLTTPQKYLCIKISFFKQ